MDCMSWEKFSIINCHAWLGVAEKDEDIIVGASWFTVTSDQFILGPWPADNSSDDQEVKLFKHD